MSNYTAPNISDLQFPSSESRSIDSNAKSLDYAINGEGTFTTGRGKVLQTYSEAIKSIGFKQGGTFGDGGTINSNSELVFNAADNWFYQHAGATPVAIPSAPDDNWIRFNSNDHEFLSGRNSRGSHDAGAISGVIRAFGSISEMILNVGGIGYELGDFVTVRSADYGNQDFVVSTSGIHDLGGGLFADTAKPEKVSTRISSDGIDTDQYTALTPPSGFPEIDYQVVRTSSGFTTNFDFEGKRRTDLTPYYVDYDNGDDSNAGTYADPLKTISAALSKSGNVELRMFPSIHRWDSLPTGVISKTFNMVCIDKRKKAYVTNTEAASWIKTPGFANVYQATFVNTPLYWSFDSFGSGGGFVYTRLGKQSSVESVDSDDGSMYIDGNTVYVHTTNSRPADDLIKIHVDVEMITVTGQESAYLENIIFEGGINGGYKSIGVDGEHETFAVSCGFNGSQGGEGGVKCAGFGKFYTRNCVSVNNNQDGFNYKFNGSTSTGMFLEDNCVGARNGESEAAINDQGSTTHDGICGVRVGGSYVDNFGPGIGDITSGSQTWNIGCWSGVSSSSVSTAVVGYTAYTGATVYLDYCQSSGGRYSIFSDVGATIYVRGGCYDKPSQTGSGSILSRDEANRDVFQGSLGNFYVPRDLYVTGGINGASASIASDSSWSIDIDRTENAIIDKIAQLGVSGGSATTNFLQLGADGSALAMLGLSAGNLGNFTIQGTYSPFTGTHIYYSDTLIDEGFAVDLVDPFQTKVSHYVCEGKVELCNKDASTVCVGIVESCELIGGVYVVSVASVGDNRTNKLNGFRVSESVRAGEILVTSRAGRLRPSDGSEGKSSVRFKCLQDSEPSGRPYGFFI